MATIMDTFNAVQTTPEGRELDQRIRDLAAIVFKQQQVIENLHQDIRTLEGFVTRGTWFGTKPRKELVEEMENTSMTAEILDAVESDFWIEGPVTGQRLRRD